MALEAVGVVLGAIALLIAVVDGYDSAMGTLWALSHWRLLLGRMRRDLIILRASYKLSIRRFFAPATSPAELEEMIEHTHSDLWRSPRILDSVRRTLGDTATAYALLVEEIERILGELMDLLDIKKLPLALHSSISGLNIAVTSALANMSGLERFGRRLRLLWQSRRADRLLKALEQRDFQLERLLSKAPKLMARLDEPIPLHVSLIETKLHRVQRSADVLNAALAKALACKFSESHSVSLRLEECVNAGGDWTTRLDGKENPDATMNFTLAFCDTPASRRRRKARLRVPCSVPAAHRDFGDLCTTTSSGPNAPSCLSFHLDKQGIAHSTYEEQDLPFVDDSETATLVDILATSSQSFIHRRLHPRLTDIEVRIVGIILTSSLLQLYSTMWLSNGWSKASIVLLRHRRPAQDFGSFGDVFITKASASKPQQAATHDPGKPAAAGSSLHREEAIGTAPRGAAQATSFSGTLSSPSTAVHDNVLMLGLGIMLLEIALGQSVEARRRQIRAGDRASPPDRLSDLLFVREWMEEEGYLLTPQLYDAIGFCLDCSTNTHVTLCEQRFRYMIIEKVLLPLYAELETLTQSTLARRL